MFYELAYAILTVLILMNLYYIIVNNRKVKIDANIPLQGRVVAIFFALLCLIILLTQGWGRWQLYLMALLALYLLTYVMTASGIGEKGIYHNGQFIKTEKIQFYALDKTDKPRYRLRVNTIKRELAMFIDEEKKDQVVAALAGMGIDSFESYRAEKNEQSKNKQNKKKGR